MDCGEKGEGAKGARFEAPDCDSGKVKVVERVTRKPTNQRIADGPWVHSPLVQNVTLYLFKNKLKNIIYIIVIISP